MKGKVSKSITAWKHQNLIFNFLFRKVILNCILTCAELLPITLTSFFSLYCAH